MKHTPIAVGLAKYYYTEEQFSHVLRVADLAIKGMGETLDADRLYSVAILHDILEDTHIGLDYLRSKMGDEITDDVYSLTRSPLDTYMVYVGKIGCMGTSYAIRVKQADIKDHLKQKETLTDSLQERYLRALPLLI